MVGPRYFKTLGVGALEGLDFDGRATMDGPRVGIVSEMLATATLFTGANVSATLAKLLRPVQQIVQ